MTDGTDPGETAPERFPVTRVPLGCITKSAGINRHAPAIRKWRIGVCCGVLQERRPDIDQRVAILTVLNTNS
jgi:hypothetical protein